MSLPVDHIPLVHEYFSFLFARFPSNTEISPISDENFLKSSNLYICQITEVIRQLLCKQVSCQKQNIYKCPFTIKSQKLRESEVKIS